jgi:hypothetical protein
VTLHTFFDHTAPAVPRTVEPQVRGAFLKSEAPLQAYRGTSLMRIRPPPLG